MYSSKVSSEKCPNCGQRTVVGTSWSCQWCRWPLAGRYPQLDEQEQGTASQAARRGALYGAILILVLILIAVGVNSWEWSAVPNMFQELWPVFLFAVGLMVVVSLGVNVLITRYAGREGKFFFFGFFVLGAVLFFASLKTSTVMQPLASYIQNLFHINLFAASVGIFSLAVAIRMVASARRRD